MLLVMDFREEEQTPESLSCHQHLFRICCGSMASLRSVVVEAKGFKADFTTREIGRSASSWGHYAVSASKTCCRVITLKGPGEKISECHK